MNSSPSVQRCSTHLIVFCGFEGSGKNKAAEYLVEEKGFVARSFAHNLKLAVCSIFGYAFNMIEGVTDASRIWREQVDEYWFVRLDMPGLTPRKILQNIGTDLFRDLFHRDIWVLSLERQILDDFAKGYKVVITDHYTTRSGCVRVVLFELRSDLRFVSELELIKRLGGVVCRVDRKESEPKWLDQYREFRQTHKSLPLNITVAKFHEETGVHPSETSLACSDPSMYNCCRRQQLYIRGS